MTTAARLPPVGRPEATPFAVSPRWKIVLLQLIVAYLMALRLWFDVTVNPMGDEAYYWMWGQHPSWSYFDHPPLHGWLQGAVAAIFGWSNFSVRLLTWLSTAGTLWIVWLWAGRLAPAESRASWFWHTAVIYFTMPVINLTTGIAFHDHLLLLWVAASLYAFHTFADAWEADRREWRWLYLSAALLGLAVLTKYNGVFLGIGYAVWVLLRPKLRRLLLTPQLWLAALLSVAIQFPVLYWNLAEGMASFRFHLSERPSVDWTQPRPIRLLSFLGSGVLSISPVLFLAALRLPWMKVRGVGENLARGLTGSIYFSSLLLWALISLYAPVFLHWNIAAYAALLPMLYRLIGGRLLFALHVALGLVFATSAALTYTLTPINYVAFSDPGAPANYGWADVGARVTAQQAAHPGSFLGATRYTYAAQLGFVLHDADIAAFNPLTSQNDFWWDAPAHAGKDAIIVADKFFPIKDAEKHFASVEKLETVPARDRLGNAVWRFDIWLGRAYQPEAAP